MAQQGGRFVFVNASKPATDYSRYSDANGFLLLDISNADRQAIETLYTQIPFHQMGWQSACHLVARVYTNTWVWTSSNNSQGLHAEQNLLHACSMATGFHQHSTVPISSMAVTLEPCSENRYPGHDCLRLFRPGGGSIGPGVTGEFTPNPNTPWTPVFYFQEQTQKGQRSAYGTKVRSEKGRDNFLQGYSTTNQNNVHWLQSALGGGQSSSTGGGAGGGYGYGGGGYGGYGYTASGGKPAQVPARSSNYTAASGKENRPVVVQPRRKN